MKIVNNAQQLENGSKATKYFSAYITLKRDTCLEG